MRVIIAGSRGICDYELVEEALHSSDLTPTEIVSGCAEGVDQLGEEWALQHEIPITRFPAEWAVFGKQAGPIRNAEMAKNSDALIALWDGKSRGTKNMIDNAINKQLIVKVFIIDRDSEIKEIRDFSPDVALLDRLLGNNFSSASGNQHAL